MTVFGAEQPLVLARELTKLHEEFLRGTVSEILRTLRERPVVRGEMVLLLPGGPVRNGRGEDAPVQTTLAEDVAARMRSEGASEMDALKLVARARGLGKSEAYREWQRGKAKVPRRS